MASSVTTVRISRGTLQELERLRDEMNAKSIDATVAQLIRTNRRRILAESFGADKARLRPFRPEDRGEDR